MMQIQVTISRPVAGAGEWGSAECGVRNAECATCATVAGAEPWRCPGKALSRAVSGAAVEGLVVGNGGGGVVTARRGIAKALPRPPERYHSWHRGLIYLSCSLMVVFSLISTAAAQRPFGGDPYRAPANQGQVAGMVSQIGIDQRLGETLPLEIELRDEAGQAVKLGEFFHEQPVVLMLVYYRCPMLCTQVANGFLKSSQAIKYAIGRDYQVVTVSFDPRETAELAAEKKASYVRAYRREGAAEGWHFLTGDEDAIRRLTDAVGFRYRYDPKSDQFAHASGIVVATPDGKLSRYFYGIDYEPSHLRMALIESSQGRIGTPVEKVLLMCFHYDPLTGKYGLAIAAALRLGGVLTILILGGFLIAMYRQERRRSQAARNETVVKENEFALSGADGIASS